MSDKGRLLDRYFMRHCGGSLEGVLPRRVGADEIVEALWPLNELFQADSARIKAVPYQQELGKQADKAIERFADAGSWVAVSLEVKRILYERHVQAIMWFTLEGNAAPWKTYMSVPETLPPTALPAAILLFLIHGMALPYPVTG